MPVEFLSQQRRQRLGRFSDDPTAEQLCYFHHFHLDDADRALVYRRSRERARLGFALQLGTVRFVVTETASSQRGHLPAHEGLEADVVDLPEVLLEVANWTGFIEEFTHVSEAGSRVEDLATSICAVLIAEACLGTSVGSDRKAWWPRRGGGEVASVGDLRFVVPVPSIHTGRNPKY